MPLHADSRRVYINACLEKIHSAFNIPRFFCSDRLCVPFAFATVAKIEQKDRESVFMQIVGICEHVTVVAAPAVGQDDSCAVRAANEPPGQPQTIAALEGNFLQWQVEWLRVNRGIRRTMDKFLRGVPTDPRHYNSHNSEND